MFFVHCLKNFRRREINLFTWRIHFAPLIFSVVHCPCPKDYVGLLEKVFLVVGCMEHCVAEVMMCFETSLLPLSLK